MCHTFGFILYFLHHYFHKILNFNLFTMVIKRVGQPVFYVQLFLFGFAVAVTFLYCFTLTMVKSSPSYLQRHKIPWKPSANETVILFWTNFFSKTLQNDNKIWRQAQACPNKCHLIVDRNAVERSDAVVFHSRDTHPDDLPPNRVPNQPWVYFQHESPIHTYTVTESFNNFFNWTMTYRLDSDVYYPYFLTLPLISSFHPPPDIQQLVASKTKLVAWVASNCWTFSKREAYVNELSTHIPVDIYGKCGNLNCPVSEDIDQGCGTILGPQYKFYLAFENSLCQDYITEKFGNALRYHMVPIVYGGGNYSRVAPPNSYIDIKDFESPKDLAMYLEHLDQNPKQYLEYFQWKLQYRVEEGGKAWCDLCTKIENMKDEGRQVSKTYTNLRSWWFGNETEMCATKKFSWEFEQNEWIRMVEKK